MSKEIALTRGMVAIVDDEDYERVNGYSWHAIKGHNVWYASSAIKVGEGQYKRARMHRFILGLDDSDPGVDHINHNGLDNRKGNLRVATAQQNTFNQPPFWKAKKASRYVGVSKTKSGQRWRATVHIDGRRKQIGSFGAQEDAARAYDAAVRRLHGPDAFTNF